MAIDKLSRRAFLHTALTCSVAALMSRVAWAGTPPRRGHVLVIGAGIAGLAAARELGAAGFECSIIEARGRAGGRIWTSRDLGHPVDMGASWIHGHRRNPITALARTYGIRTVATDFDSIVLHDHGGRRMQDSELEQHWNRYRQLREQAERYASRQDADHSIAEAILHAMKQAKLDAAERRFVQSMLLGMETESAADLSRLSAWYADSGEGFEGDDLMFPDGYDQIVNALARDLPISYGHAVRSIHHDERGVRVETEGKTFEGEAAVVTLPLGVLKLGQVVFDPPLPDYKRKSIARLGMGTLNKVAMRFSTDTPRPEAEFLWTLASADAFEEQAMPVSDACMGCHAKLPGASFVKKKGDFSEFLNIGHYVPGAPTVVAFTGGPSAWRLEGLSDAEIGRRVTARLGQLEGRSFGAPERMVVSRWMSDPYACGSYSHVRVGSTPDDFDALARPVGPLYFAGEATHRDYPGTVHGAYLSGLRDARSISGRL